MYAAGIDTEAGFADIIGGAGASGEAGVKTAKLLTTVIPFQVPNVR